MQWVFDASVTMAWCFDDERTAHTDSLLERLESGVPAVVPQIWPLEVANTLLVAVRRRRLTVADRTQFLATLSTAPITVDPETARHACSEVLTLAETYQLSSYDAAYLELAMRLGVPLATLDQPLLAAARAVGVAVL